MGKSDKKIKSARINALKQQYEAFLEEDKKRRERNEYILGRLDKMRLCSAMVQHRSRPVVGGRPQTTAYIRSDPKPLESPANTRCDRNIEVDTVNNNKDSLILEEIVKQYILIPKRSTVVIDNITSHGNEFKPKVDENVDWKSKYEILDKLKGSEKAGSDYSFIQRDDPNNSNNQKVNYNQVPNTESVEFSNQCVQPTTQYKYELPDKDILPDNTMAYKKHYKNKKNELHLNEKADLYDEKAIRETNMQYDRDIAIKNNFDFKTKYSELQSGCRNAENAPKQLNLSSTENATHQNIPENSPEIPVIFTEGKNERADEKVNLPQNSHDLPDMYTEGKNEMVYEKVNHVFEDDLKPIQTLNPNEFENSITNESPIEDSQYPIETIQVSDFTPDNDVQLQDGVNINPEGYSINQSHFDSSYYNPQTTRLTDSSPHYNTQDEVSVNETTFARTQKYASEPTAITAEDNVHATSNYEPEPMLPADNASQNPQHYEQNNETAIASDSVDKPAIDTGDINEIEAEQIDMFFPETKPDNIKQGAAGDVAAVGRDDYNVPEEAYTGNYTQNENFEQNEQLFNDLGETTQPYDPSYEQQYAATYEEQKQLDSQGYAQQQDAYEQQQQQNYEQQHDYVQQPIGYDQFNQEAYDELQHQQQENYEAPALMEQQLDAEQGYDEYEIKQVQEENVAENQQDKEKLQQVSSK